MKLPDNFRPNLASKIAKNSGGIWQKLKKKFFLSRERSYQGIVMLG